MTKTHEVVIRRVENGEVHAVVASGARAVGLLLVLGERVLSEGVVATEGSEEARNVSFNIPGEVISDGVSLLEIKRKPTDDALATICIIAGQPLQHDLHHEVAMLRAELDMLKAAFRASARRGPK